MRLRGALRGLAGEAGGAARRASGDGGASRAPRALRQGAWERPGTPCGRPGPAEAPAERGGAWGEFAGFREPAATSPEHLEGPADPQPPGAASRRERGGHRPHPGGPGGTRRAAPTPPEPLLGYEKTFKFAFQEVPVQQATEGVSTLDHFLNSSSEERPGLESVHKQLCSESRKLWRVLQNTSTTSAPRCPWTGSRCRENLFLVLGIDAALKGRRSEGSGPAAPEEAPGGGGVHVNPCAALIQTKLSEAPGSRQGCLVTYSLFLKKTPLPGSVPSLSAPRRKVFTVRQLTTAWPNGDGH
ncbi:uncharacterized protein CLBA1 [Dasypus novemcinctus]|uniref:uncharacterized protein CLBA1 n=1 Tax=Dasypus novemcinctus TaxID=9361 RepID=UPI00265E14EE|nr:uncharacterized protein CLBA1 [Dasypus novemcinctus]